MENLNQQLLDVNQTLVKKIKILEPVYNEKNNESKLKNQELIQNYENLLEERENITKKLNEYETLENAENDNQVKLTQNYYSYILLLILVLVVFILLYKMFGSGSNTTQYGGELGINAYYMIFGLIIFVIILNFSIKYLTL